MASSESTCYTIVFEDGTETPTIQELRSALEKGSDEVKLETLRKIIVATVNGNSMVRSLCAGIVCWEAYVVFLCADGASIMDGCSLNCSCRSSNM